MPITVLTETSAYLIDLDAMTATRLPGDGAGADTSMPTPPLLADLRRDAEAIPLLNRPELVIGQPMTLLLNLVGDGITTTVRRTTNVREIIQ
jgi:hypothetical protein